MLRRSKPVSLPNKMPETGSRPDRDRRPPSAGGGKTPPSRDLRKLRPVPGDRPRRDVVLRDLRPGERSRRRARTPRRAPASCRGGMAPV